ncbi:WD40 repeat-like protein [Trichoderma reesei RUT C-30]|uniref:WD40 repeat-like protein n=1 Tax=Hypocrea jecorina (strain ATCC 56765 / BCRC 32924 / NRRL 11460 / Rut C-30) TaxID=1344414 RepID=A0A024RV60_HYPJR|nr:WD40 repeat-like protein [Trichoderma reesei RUT C-30]
MADALGLVSSIIAVVDLFIKVGVQCSIYCSGVKDAPRDIRQILNEADRTTATLEDLRRLLASPTGARLSSSQRVCQSIEDARLQLQDLAFKLEGGLRTGQRLRWPLRKEEVAGIISQLQKCRASIALDLQVDQTYEAVLAKLRTAKGAAFDSPSHANSSKCYPGTREGILRQIQTWSTKSDGQCIFWLNGGAGTGKSTISRTVAQFFADNGILGASFFFKHGEADRGNMALFFPTMASQLIQAFPQIAPHVRAAVEADPTIHDRSIKEQFDKLIADPIIMASKASQLPTIVVVADALDECDNDEHVRLVIHLLSQTRHFTSASLKFFVTSRPELAIRLGFADICGQYEDLMLHQVPRVAIEHDITLFLEHEIAMIRQDYNKSVSVNRQLPLSWPGIQSFQRLVSMSIPLFIFAATACRFIQDRRIGGPKEQLAKILQHQTGHGPTSNLDATYLPIVNGLLAGLSDVEKGFVSERFRRIVGSIVTLANPLCAPSLARLLGMPRESVEDLLDLLHSVLYIPTDARLPVRVLHLSFRDFLVDPTKASAADKYPLWIDQQKAHRVLATRCLELLLEEGTLRRNICGLKLPSTSRSEVCQSTLEAALPSEVQYACLYWVFHWRESMSKVEDGGLVDCFLNSHLLHWFEALGLLGHISECIGMINDLLDLLERGVLLSALLRDARRIILSNRAIIDTSPLQVYYSVILFAPEESIVKTRFRSELPVWFTVSPPIASKWDACLQTLEGHTSFVRSVAFSHDSKLLVTASADSTIRIWEVVSGTCISTLVGSDSRVSSVTFSHDSKFIASATLREIRLWDAVTGLCASILDGHGDNICTIAFSHDSRLLASTSRDGTIKVWDSTSGICTLTLNGHSKTVDCVAFSQQSTVLVSSSYDSCIKRWDVTTGDCKTTIKIDRGTDQPAALSRDSRILAAASNSAGDKCIRLLNTANGECISTFESHGHTLESACFSHDSTMLALVYGGNYVRVWDIATTTSIATFKGHAKPLRGIAFSHDAKLLATASYDNTIKIWDLEAGVWDVGSGACIAILAGHSSWVNYLAFLPQADVLVSSSGDRTIRIWDIGTAACTATFEGQSEPWNESIAFSHDYKLLASGKDDGSIDVWDISTGERRMKLAGESRGRVYIVAFSQSPGLLASIASRRQGLYNSQLALDFWNVSTGLRLAGVDISRHTLHCFSFDKVRPCLSISVGKFELKADAKVQICRRGIGLSNDEEWVVWDDDKMIWLPPAYRPSDIAVIGSTMAIYCSKPDMIFFTISPDLIHLEYHSLDDE